MNQWSMDMQAAAVGDQESDAHGLNSDIDVFESSRKGGCDVGRLVTVGLPSFRINGRTTNYRSKNYQAVTNYHHDPAWNWMCS
jgi:hypothetical protein